LLPVIMQLWHNQSSFASLAAKQSRKYRRIVHSCTHPEQPIGRPAKAQARASEQPVSVN
jgi:hypothetical protein